MRFKTLLIAFLAIAVTACNSKTQDQGKEIIAHNTLDQLISQAQEDPDNDELHFQLAEAYQAAHQPNEAVQSMQQAIEANPKHIPHYLYLADLFMEMGQIKNTMMILQQASVVDDQNIDVKLKSAEIHFMFKKYTETFEYVNKVLEKDPHNDRAFFLRGFVYKEMGDTNKAVENFMESINNNPEHFNSYMELGNIFSARRNPLAIEYYGNAMKLDSTRIEPYYSLGMFYQNNRMNTEAIAIYKILIDFAPEYVHAPYNIGYIYLEHLFEPQEASNYFSQAIIVNPEFVEAYYNRGLCYESMDMPNEARQDYNTALKLRTNYMLAIEGLNRLDKGSTEKRDHIKKQRELLNQ